MPFLIQIATGGSVPVYRQITDQVRMAVATGGLRSGEQLPSVRALAEQLIINPNTVTRAYADLAREGIIDAQQGRGFFVAPRRQIYAPEERQRRLHAALEAFLNEIALLDFPPEEILELLRCKLAELESQRGVEVGYA